MAKNKVDLEIGVEYDPTGAERAEEGMQQVKQAAEAAVAAETQATAAPAGGAQADGSGAAEGVQTTGAAAAEAAEKLTLMGKVAKESQETLIEGAEKSTRALKEEQEQIEKVTAALEEAGKSGEKLDLTSGAEEQKEALEHVVAALDEVAEQLRQEVSAEQQAATAAVSTANARKGAASAAQDEAARTKALAEQMKLEAMSKRALTAEVQRLTAARKAAAQAGDEKAYQSLTAQYKQAKGALDQMTQAVNLQKTAMMGQASAGMQVANTLGSLGNQLRSGQVDLAGMANGVMSLGMALKAGLGPIGWVMLAIQGLQAAIELCGDKTEELRDKQLDYARKQAEVATQLEAAGRAMAEALLAPQERAAREEARQRELAGKREREDLSRAQRIARDKRSATLQALREEGEAREAELQRQISQQAAADAAMYGAGAQKTDKLKALENELYQTRREYAEKIRATEAANREADAKDALDTAALTQKQAAASLAATNEQLDKLKESESEDLAILENPLLQELLDKIDKHQAEIKEGEARVKDAENWREKNEVGVGDRIKGVVDAYVTTAQAQISALTMDMEGLRNCGMEYKKAWDKVLASNEGLNFAVQVEKNSVLSAQESLQEIKEELAKLLGCEVDEVDARLGALLPLKQYKETLEHTRDEQELILKAATNETAAANDAVDEAKRSAVAGGKLAEAKRGAADAEWERQQQEQADAEAQRKRRDEWEEVQKQTLDAQREWLRRTIASLPENSEERKNWMKQLDSNEAAIRMKGWQEAQTRTLAEQQAYVERMLGATQEGTLEYEKWALEAKKLNNKQTLEALRQVGERFKTSRSYSEQDLRIEAEQIRADGDILRRKKEYLESLKMRPDNDAATEKAINDLLKETKKAINGYKQAMQQRSLQAQRDLQNSKPPDLKTTHKGLAGSLHQAQEAYRRIAARMERAAANGDEKAVAKWGDALKRNVRQQEALTGKTGKVVQHMQGDLAKAQSILSSEVKGLTARQRMNSQINTATETRRQKEMRLKREKEREAAEAEKNRKSGKDADVGEAKKKAARSYDKLSQHIDKEVSDAAQNSGQVNAQDVAAKVATMQQTVNETRRQMEECRTLLAAANTSMGALAPAVAQMVGVCQTLVNTTGAALRNIRTELSNLKETVNNLRREI